MKRLSVFAGVLICVVLLIAADLAQAVPGHSQQSPTPQLSFEVASIKPAKSQADIPILIDGQPRAAHGGSCHGVDSKYSAVFAGSAPPLGRCFYSTTLRGLIEFAYRAPEQKSAFMRVSGGEGWVGSDVFDVEAKAEDPSNTTEKQLRLMLQTLLREQFKLQFHQEPHEEQGFALLVAKNGPKLKAATGNETRPGVPLIARDGAGFVITDEKVALETFTGPLSSILQQLVQDQTGLDGNYDIVLHWTPGAGEVVSANPTTSADTDPSGPSIFTAVQEQLGLRLEPRKVPIEFLIVDHAEKPAEN